MNQRIEAPDEEMLEHPDGCMCEECRIERGEIPPKKKPGRPRNPSPPTNGGQNSNKFLTPQVDRPDNPHSLYEYERGELRRCHLCGDDPSQHLNFTADECWFSTLEARARHILEYHTDESDPIVKRERQRSKEILGIAEIWNSHSYGKQVNFKKGLKEEYTAPVAPPMQQQSSNPISSLFGKKQPKTIKPAGQGNWFSRNKLVTAVIVIAALYGLYYLYLLSQGYE